MLSSCSAFVLAQTPAQNRSLTKLAERAGFGFVGTILGERRVAIEATRRDIVFFLLHHQIPDLAKGAILRRIRESSEAAVRYAPICLVSPDCPFETVLKYVEFGFDDIITLPERREALIGRLLSQLDAPHTYVETTNYVGPDRRRMEVASHRDERRHGEQGFLRLTVHRSIDDGVRILRREMVGSHTRPGLADPLRSRGATEMPAMMRA